MRDFKDEQIKKEEEDIAKLNLFVNKIFNTSEEEIIEKGEEGKQAFLNFFNDIGYTVEYDLITEYILRKSDNVVFSDYILQNYTLRQGKQSCIDFLNRRILECQTRLNNLK